MNCEKCQELLSDYVDGDLSIEDRRQLAAHLDDCVPCFSVSEDIDAIVSFCRDHRGEYDPVPNSRAMWIRIRNTIDADREAVQAQTVQTVESGTGIWARLGMTKWQLTFPQLIATVSAIAIAVSIITTASLRKLGNVSTGSETAILGPDVRNAPVTRNSSADLDRRISQQQLDINYLNQRIEQRKAQWSPQIRSAFEKNLLVIDRAVNESRQQLVQNPHDEISEEMLNVAMDEKRGLLKDFSDQ